MGRLFGTDGVRGVANRELTSTLAYEIGKAAALVLSNESKKPKFLIGMDTRLSGCMLENALTAGILSVGGTAVKLGILPTPAIAMLVKHYGADAGVVISASHNSFEYNGIKIFNSDGYKLDDSTEEKIEDIILAHEYHGPEFIGADIGRIEIVDDGLDIYTSFLIDTFDGNKLDGVKVVLDTANGASYETAKEVYEKLGANIVVINDNPNGININDNCGSTHPEALQKKVVEVGADMGFAFDGDADRLIVVDELGRILDGDVVMCVCAKMLKNSGELYDNKLTATVMSNIGLHKHLEECGIAVDVTKVGDRYVLESMIETGSVIGGEQSGHMIFKNYTTTGDGVLSSLQFIKAVMASGKKVSDLRDEVKIYPQSLVNVKIRNEYKKTVLDSEEVISSIKKVEEKIGDTGRVLIRPSGTEPLIRVMIEGENEAEIEKYAKDIAGVIEKKFS